MVSLRAGWKGNRLGVNWVAGLVMKKAVLLVVEKESYWVASLDPLLEGMKVDLLDHSWVE